MHRRPARSIGLPALGHHPRSCRGRWGRGPRKAQAAPGEPREHRALDRARPPIDRGAGRVCGRLDARRHGVHHSLDRAGRRDGSRRDRRPAERRPGETRASSSPACGLRPSVEVRRAVGHRPVAIPRRRPAGPHQGRLQHGQVPRRGLGQGRIPPFAVRIRSRGRPLPPDPRGRREADRPGRSRRVPAHEQGDGPGVPHRRQADRARKRGLSADPGVARGRRTGRPRPVLPSRSASRSSRRERSSALRPRPSGSSSERDTRTGPTATSPASPSSSATMTRPSRWTSRGSPWVGVPARRSCWPGSTSSPPAYRSSCGPGRRFIRPDTPTFNEIDTARACQARPAPRRAVGGLLRRDVPAPRVHRLDRPAADPRRTDAIPGRPFSREARGLGRSFD